MLQVSMLPVAILAGGLATRLRPITQTIPKALVDVAGQPFIVRQFVYLQSQGIRDVVICVGYLGEMIQAVVGNGARIGMNVRYSYDGPILLGTGGALKKAVPLLGDDFFVLYGDSFLPIDFVAVQQVYQTSGPQALMTVLKNSNRWDTSNVLFSDGRLAEYNKRSPSAGMAHIDYGLGLMAAEVLSKYSATESFDLADVYEDLSGQGRLCGMEVYQRFYEIGSHMGLQEAETYFLTLESS